MDDHRERRERALLAFSYALAVLLAFATAAVALTSPAAIALDVLFGALGFTVGTLYAVRLGAGGDE